MTWNFDRGRPVILASASPRRRDLMIQAGYDFDLVVPGVEEIHNASQSAGDLTRQNAQIKALSVAARYPARLVIGADTLVAIDGCVLGKPADDDEALRMLTRLAGRTHEVCTAVVLACGSSPGDVSLTAFEELTRVRFLPLTKLQILEYLELINPFDKAGSYAAQEHGDRIICGVEGSWTNVVGLPVERLALELRKLEIHPAASTAAPVR